jgi:hypothetical protein
MAQDSLEQQTSQDREYIRALIEDLESDKKSVLLYLVFELGLIVVVMTKTFPNSNSLPFLVLVSLSLLIISVLLFFKYFRELHCARLKVTTCFRKTDVDEAHRIVKSEETGIWHHHKAKYNWAKGFLYAGVCLYLLELWVLHVCDSAIIEKLLRSMCQT